MNKSKEIVRKNLGSMSEDDMITEFDAHVTIEFSIKKNKFIFRNIKNSFLKDFSIAKFIEALTLEAEWYNYSSYDMIDILGETFLITESTKNKIVLVQGN